jgi:hypothetical protein
MAETVDRELKVHRTDDEPVKKLPKLMYEFFDKFDPNDPAQVASRLVREQREAERKRVRCTCIVQVSTGIGRPSHCFMVLRGRTGKHGTTHFPFLKHRHSQTE